MKTKYQVLTEQGEWKVIASEKPIRNLKTASKIANETVIQYKVGTIIDQLKFWKR